MARPPSKAALNKYLLGFGTLAIVPDPNPGRRRRRSNATRT
jgi:hypothetical protein